MIKTERAKPRRLVSSYALRRQKADKRIHKTGAIGGDWRAETIKKPSHIVATKFPESLLHQQHQGNRSSITVVTMKRYDYHCE
eukprot:scaffold712_cov69-Cyclotella_meneghiniana.AAC.5